MLSAQAADTTPSAEMLLYLAEFADDSGQPEDPVALTTEPSTPKPAHATRNESTSDDASERTPPEPHADD
jgi:hypothetical protein